MKRILWVNMLILSISFFLFADSEISPEVAFPFLFTEKNLYNALPVATSSYPSDKWGNYSAQSAFDGKTNTAWVEGAEGDGIGEGILFVVPENAKSLNIVNGYAVKNVFKSNNRIRKAKLNVYYAAYKWKTSWKDSLSNLVLHSQAIIELSDTMIFQEISLDKDKYPDENDRVFLGFLEIQSVYKGKDPDTSISEINIIPYSFEDFTGGTWHGDPMIAAGYSDRYIFNKDNTYYWLPPQQAFVPVEGEKAGKERKVGASPGEWKRKKNSLTLSEGMKTSEHIISGIDFSPAFFKYVLYIDKRMYFYFDYLVYDQGELPVK